MDNDLIDLSRNLLNKDGSPFERWIVDVRREFNNQKIITEFFLTGKSHGQCPSDFDYELLSKGILIESEHSSNVYIQTKICMDHLAENIDYYNILERNKL